MIKLCDFGSATTETHFPDRSWSAIQRSLVEDEVIIKLICFDPFIFSFFFPIWLMLHSQSTFGKGCAVILNQVSRLKVKKVWVDFCVKSLYRPYNCLSCWADMANDRVLNTSLIQCFLVKGRPWTKCLCQRWKSYQTC